MSCRFGLGRVRVCVHVLRVRLWDLRCQVGCQTARRFEFKSQLNVNGDQALSLILFLGLVGSIEPGHTSRVANRASGRTCDEVRSRS